MKLTESVQHYIDGASGQYIPKRFAIETKRECVSGVKPEDLDYLARGPGGVLDKDETLADGETERGEFYWDIWQDVLDNAIVTDPESGIKFRLYQDDSLFLVPENWDWNEDINGFEPPESDTLRRYELPSYWASYLINGDGSGLEDGEEKQIESFLASEGLESWTCADVSDNTWFAHGNDATNLGGDVARYTFVLIGKPSEAKA